MLPVKPHTDYPESAYTYAVYGKRQGFEGLPSIHATVLDPIMGICEEWTHAYQPNASELEALNKGAAVYLSIRQIGLTGPVPQVMFVGEPPEDAPITDETMQAIAKAIKR